MENFLKPRATRPMKPSRDFTALEQINAEVIDILIDHIKFKRLRSQAADALSNEFINRAMGLHRVAEAHVLLAKSLGLKLYTATFFSPEDRFWLNMNWTFEELDSIKDYPGFYTLLPNGTLSTMSLPVSPKNMLRAIFSDRF